MDQGTNRHLRIGIPNTKKNFKPERKDHCEKTSTDRIEVKRKNLQDSSPEETADKKKVAEKKTVWESNEITVNQGEKRKKRLGKGKKFTLGKGKSLAGAMGGGQVCIDDRRQSKKRGGKGRGGSLVIKIATRSLCWGDPERILPKL